MARSRVKIKELHQSLGIPYYRDRDTTVVSFRVGMHPRSNTRCLFLEEKNVSEPHIVYLYIPNHMSITGITISEGRDIPDYQAIQACLALGLNHAPID